MEQIEWENAMIGEFRMGKFILSSIFPFENII